MEIKIGVQQTARELALESDQSPEEIDAAVRKAVADGGILSLEDSRGRRVMVPADRIAYVEFSSASARRVGFGT